MPALTQSELCRFWMLLLLLGESSPSTSTNTERGFRARHDHPVDQQHQATRHDQQSYTHEEWTMSSDERDTTTMALRSETRPTRSEARTTKNEQQLTRTDHRGTGHDRPTRNVSPLTRNQIRGLENRTRTELRERVTNHEDPEPRPTRNEPRQRQPERMKTKQRRRGTSHSPRTTNRHNSRMTNEDQVLHEDYFSPVTGPAISRTARRPSQYLPYRIVGYLSYLLPNVLLVYR
ncbi:hypothetical protein BDZ89DRAFT_1067598 [Hymenopellis radicata]|nr:hypothetical protein BDZ89DRAFT_1067598 [Hymenopellis radicata]